MKTYGTKKTTAEAMGTLDGLRAAYHESAITAYNEIVNLRDALKNLVLCDYDAADAAVAKTDSVFHCGLIYDREFYIMNCAEVLSLAAECVNECLPIVDNTIYQLSDDCDYSYEYYYYDPCGLFAMDCVSDTLQNGFDPDIADTRMLIHDRVLPEILREVDIHDVSERVTHEINFLEMGYDRVSIGLCDIELPELLPACASFFAMCEDFGVLIKEPIINRCDSLIFGPWGLYDCILDECEHDPAYADALAS